jgi:hypothetical protein
VAGGCDPEWTGAVAGEPRGVPYGWCDAGYVWRQAYRGDYVCATPSQAAQVNADNAAAQSRFQSDVQ